MKYLTQVKLMHHTEDRRHELTAYVEPRHAKVGRRGMYDRREWTVTAVYRAYSADYIAWWIKLQPSDHTKQARIDPSR